MTTARNRSRLTSRGSDVFFLMWALALAVKVFAPGLFTPAPVSAWLTVFVAICVQSTPYLVLGVLLSTAISVFLPAVVLARVIPRRAALAVPVTGLAGALLPGCECGSVPVAAGLLRRGVAAGPALTFLLSAPAINPVVLVATSVAFPHHPMVVWARAGASFATALLMGWLWNRRRDKPEPRARFDRTASASVWEQARQVAFHDVASSLGLLTIGAATSATLNVAVPRGFMDGLAHHESLAIPAMAILAILLAVCSEADAFVAASLTQFSLTARLVFMVVGPTVDVKLIAMQAGTFGRAFAARFAPITAVVATGCAAVVGAWLL